MRQRVVIALALAAEPQLIVADEPTTALDVSIQAQIIALLKRLCREHGAAVMLVTHDMGVIAETCDRVAVMYAGRIVEIGPVRRRDPPPAHPYTVGLMGSIPAMDEERERLLQIDGAMPRLNAIPPGCAFNPRCPQVFDRCRQRAPRPGRRRPDPRRLLAGRARRPAERGDERALRWSRCSDLGQDLRRLGAVAQPRRRAQAAPVRARGRRRQLRDPARPDAGAGRRIGLRQEHGGAAAGRAVHARRAAACSSTARTPHGTADKAQLRVMRRRMQMIFQDPYASLNPRWKVQDIVGEPLSEHGLVTDRAAVAREGRRAAAIGRPGGGGCREVPAPVLRRAAPAHLDRARAGHAAGVPGLRRADLGARRVGAGPGAQHHEGPAARARADLPVHLAQPGGGAPCVRPGRRDVPRPPGRAGRQGRSVRRAAAPLHAHAARCDSRHPHERARAHAGAGRGAQSAESAERLRVPSALPARQCALLAGAAGAARPSRASRSPATRSRKADSDALARFSRSASRGQTARARSRARG